MVQDAAPLYPTVSEQESSKMELLYNDCLLNPGEEIAPERALLGIDGITFFPRGNIQFIKAKAKQGKSHAVDILVAALTRGKLWRLEGQEEVRTILLFDTEQHRSDSMKRLERIAKLADIPVEELKGWVFVFNLRELNPAERLEVIEYAAEVNKPDVCVIDGLLDLVKSFNDLEESQAVLQRLMTLSSKYNCAIPIVLHENPGSDKMTGHLGTNGARKASEVFAVSKHGNLYYVECSVCRHKEPPAWSFRFDENDELQSGDEHLLRLQAQKEQENKAKRMDEFCKLNIPETVSTYLLAHGGQARKGELAKQLEASVVMPNGKAIAHATAYDKIDQLVNLDFLCKNDEYYSLSTAVDLDVNDSEDLLNDGYLPMES